jgi:hypothetical protein
LTSPGAVTIAADIKTGKPKNLENTPTEKEIID